MGDKMKDKKEEYSYMIDRYKESGFKRRARKAITLILTFCLLFGAIHLIDHAPWIVFSKEEIDPVDETKIETNKIYSTLDTNSVVPAALTNIETITNDGTAVKVQVDYWNEKIYVSPGPSSSTKFYFSQDKMKTWERVTGNIDLTIFLKTSDNTIYFKGNLDKAIVAVTLPKEDKNLKVSYYVEQNGANSYGRLKFENQTRPIEYRKGTYGDWKDTLSDITDLSSYEITGYTLQFRLKATNAERAGKVVSVKIPKRQTPPKIKVDYSKLEISGLKAGQTIYYKNGESQPTIFAPADSKVKTISLYDLLFNQPVTPNTVRLPAATIEFQTAGTDKKVASSIIAIEFQEQPLAPTGKITVDKTTVTFPEATKTTPYEYVVLHQGENLDLSNVKWTKVTTSKSFEIKKVGKATPAPGDVIYYRLASTTNKDTKIVTPASMYAQAYITIVPIIN